MLPLIILACSASPTGTISTLSTASDEIIRFDRVFVEPTEKHGIMTHQLTASKFIAMPFKRIMRNALAPAQAFKIDFECDATIPTAECEQARIGLQNAVARIADVLQVSQQITMAARYYPFCPASNKNCDRASGLGSAMYGSAFPIQKEGQFFTMCQGLLKQLRADKQVQFGPYDIRAEFNSDADWFFRGGQGTLQPTQYDFEFTAAHEIVHGLGFGSGLLEFSNVFPGAAPRYLAPILFGAGENTTTTDLFKYMEPIDIFDSFISNGNVQFKDLGARMQRFPIQDAPFGKFIEAFEASGDPFRAAQEAYTASVKADGSLVFTPPGGEPVVLYQPRPFEQGSSVSHVDMPAANTQDFLMIPQLANGKELDETIRTTSGTSIFGPGTVAILEAIGWPTKNKPEAGAVTMALEFGKGATGAFPADPKKASAIGLSSSLLLGLFLVL